MSDLDDLLKKREQASFCRKDEKNFKKEKGACSRSVRFCSMSISKKILDSVLVKPAGPD